MSLLITGRLEHQRQAEHAKCKRLKKHHTHYYLFIHNHVLHSVIGLSHIFNIACQLGRNYGGKVEVSAAYAICELF